MDRKFVMLMLGSPGVLAALDPHAADERVRLEALQVMIFPEWDNSRALAPATMDSRQRNSAPA